MVESHAEVDAGDTCEYTPTEIEDSATEVQSSEADVHQSCSEEDVCTTEIDSQCSTLSNVEMPQSKVHDVEPAEAEDSLIALACKPMEVVDSSDEEVEDNLRWPILPIEPSEIQPHWSETKAFKAGVEAQFKRCRGQTWFNRSSYDDIVEEVGLCDFNRCLLEATRFIRSNVDIWEKFKIGICESPWLRWNSSFGYMRNDDFDIMHILYAATTLSLIHI